MTHYDWTRAAAVNGHEAFMASSDDPRVDGLIYKDHAAGWTLRMDRPSGAHAERCLPDATDAATAVEHGDRAMHERVIHERSMDATPAEKQGWDSRQRTAEHYGFTLQSTDGGVEVYGKDGLSDTIEYNQGEWHMFRRDEQGQPIGGPEGLPGHEARRAFEWLEQRDRSDLEHWMAAERRFGADRETDLGYDR